MNEADDLQKRSEVAGSSDDWPDEVNDLIEFLGGLSLDLEFSDADGLD